MKKKTILLLITLILVGIGTFAIWKMKEKITKSQDMSPVEEIEDIENFNEIVAGLENFEDTFGKMDTFIKERLPISNIFLKFNLIDEDSEPTNDELRKELFLLLFTALTNQDLNLFTSVVSGDAIKEVWDKEIDVELRIMKMEKVLKNSSRDGKFSTLNYQFEEDQFENMTDKGILNLIYKDGVIVTIPFEIELIGQDDHRYYQFTNSIIEMEQLIQQGNQKQPTSSQ